MKTYNISDPAFRKYGRVITEFDFTPILDVLKTTPKPADHVIYSPSVPELEALPLSRMLENTIFGELPMQIGYCNGHNRKLNALEYHHSSEVNIAATDMILLLGMVQDISKEHTYPTDLVEAFYVPAGTGVEIYGTTLHYAPCSAEADGFQVAILLPRDTNLPLSGPIPVDGEARLMTAKNKWLICHEDSDCADSCVVGLLGENITL